MPEMNTPDNFQLKEIEALEKQLAEKKAALSGEQAAFMPEKIVEIGRENSLEAVQTTAAPTPAPSSTASDDNGQALADNVRIIASMDETRKIETLVAIALERGIAQSIETACGLQDPYILDRLHDKLLCELHDRLIAEKKLREI